MRELVIGDIHGCARAFRTMLELLAPQAEDTVVLLGDYIDRGPGSCEVIEMILDLRRRCTLITLAGNHEKMILAAREMLNAAEAWRMHGGKETLESYQRRGCGRSLEGIPERHWDFFTTQTLDYWETDQRIYVHGSLDPELDMKEQAPEQLFWERFTDPLVHKSGKQIICGHASQRNGLPAVFDHGLCIDTWVYGSGWLTSYDTGAQTFLQTNERGLQRQFDLAKLLKLRDVAG